MGKNLLFFFFPSSYLFLAQAAHHPFTAPQQCDEELIRSGGPAAIHARARSYDLVLNGVELGGGSVRIHDPELQLASLAMVLFCLFVSRFFFYLPLFVKVGVSRERAESSLGHLLSALAMGAPPHAGLALGLDRLMMQLLGASMKDVIAFPKAADGKELMVGSPAFLTEEESNSVRQ